MRCTAISLLILITTLAAAQQAPPADTKGLLRDAGLAYKEQADGTLCLAMRTRSGVFNTLVRRVGGQTAIFSEILALPAEQVPPLMWRRAAELNIRPYPAHIGYENGAFYAIAGADSASLDAPLLRTLVMAVSALADAMRPVFKDLSEVQ